MTNYNLRCENVSSPNYIFTALQLTALRSAVYLRWTHDEGAWPQRLNMFGMRYFSTQSSILVVVL